MRKSLSNFIKRLLDIRPDHFNALPKVWRDRLADTDWDIEPTRLLLLTSVQYAIANNLPYAVNYQVPNELFNRMLYAVHPIHKDIRSRFGVVKWDDRSISLTITTGQIDKAIQIVITEDDLFPIMMIADFEAGPGNPIYCTVRESDADPLGVAKVYRDMEYTTR